VPLSWETERVPEHTRRRRHYRARIGAALTLLAALALALVGAPAATASQGSVPAEVSAYAADPNGLVSRLDDLFGIGSGGAGIDFNETTTVGQLNRVFTFTEAFVAGVATDTPVERQNLWTAPITVNDDAIGLAVIWINPASVAPELADFVRDPGLARSLADVPADSFVVRDEQRAAWFTLAADELTPLVAGTSGLSGPIALDDFQRMMIDRSSEPVDAPQDSGLITPVTVIIVAFVGVVAILLVPQLLARRANRRGGGAAQPEREPAPEPEPTDPPEPEPASPAPKKPRAPRSPAKPKPPAESAPDPLAEPAAESAAERAAESSVESDPAAPAPKKPRAPRRPAAPPEG
jgi:hypothetical protein